MSGLFATDPSQLTVQAGARAVSFPRSWKWDHTAGDLVVDSNGRVPTVDGATAYHDWIMRTLATPRYGRPIYTRQHGCELVDILRKGLAPSVLESEIIRTITEALTADPRTKGVGDFSFARTGTAMEVSFTAYPANGDPAPVTLPIGGN